MKALTANGRMTAIILSLLPFAVVGSLLVVNPDYFMMLIKDPSGPTLLFLAMCGQVAAYIVIRRIVDIQV